MFVVDTNILVYAANPDAPESDLCASLVEEWRGSSELWFVSWGTIYEFLRVVTHEKMQHPLSAGEAWAFVEALFASPSFRVIEPTERHPAFLREVLYEVPGLAGNLMFDVRTAALMREHGIRRIVTHDRDFARFPFVEVFDPLA